jgi:type I restriction enzyme S subunit
MKVEMKDSGIPWVGVVPYNWEISKVKRIMRNKSIRNYPDEMVLSLYREFGVIPKNSRNDNHNVTSEDTSNYKYVEVGDFVINKMKAWQGSMGLSDYQGIISPAYYVCRFIGNGIYSKYIHHLLRNETYKPEYMRLSTGLRVGQWDLGIDDFLNIPIVVPPIEVQKRIVSFLDDKCADIDQLITLQQRMIDELKAYKQSVITEAVTKGLDKSVPMKDSGIEWIGKVPVGWEKVKLKNLCKKMNSGSTLTTEEISDEGNYPVYGGNGIRGYYNRFNQFEECLLIGRQGALCGNVKHTYEPIWATEHAVITLPDELANIDYLYFLLIAMNLNQHSISAAQPGLAVGFIQNVSTICPPIKEQKMIASFIETKCSQIDQLISIKQQKMDELKEYKKSMIYEYITGKKQVPN